MTRFWVHGHPDFNVYNIGSAAWEAEWDGYELHLWGDEVPTLEDAAPAAYQFGGGPDAWILTLYRACALIPGSPLIATLDIDHSAPPGKQVRGYIELTNEREWVNDDLTTAGKALRLLQGAVQIGARRRPRLEEDPRWLILMRDIDKYLRRQGATLAGAVDYYDLASLNELDDMSELLDAEIEGEDIEATRKRNALSKLKRWRARWKNLPESKRRMNSRDFT